MPKVKINKHAEKLLWAIVKVQKTEVQKTEDQYIQLIQSIVRPIIRNVLANSDGNPNPFSDM